MRDRATFYVNILKEKEKALSSGYILNGGLKIKIIKSLELYIKRIWSVECTQLKIILIIISSTFLRPSSVHCGFGESPVCVCE